VIQFGLSLLATVCALGLAGMLAIFAFMAMFSPTTGVAETTSILLMATALMIVGLLTAPSTILPLLRLSDRPQPKLPWPQGLPVWGVILGLGLLALPAAWGLGLLALKAGRAAWVVLPPAHVVAIGVPMLVIIYLAVRGLPTGSAQRAWGALGSGLVMSPVLIFTLEALVMVGFFIAAIFAMATDPELMNKMDALATAWQLRQPSEAEILSTLGPYLARPMVLFSIFLFIAVLVPLIEEAIKPLGVWLLIGRNLAPAEGFALGALSGAGYALVENLGYAMVGGEAWLMLVVQRAGTAALHVTTAGITGWALAWAWRKGWRGAWRLGLAYLSAVLIHGLWNGLAVFAALAEVGSVAPQMPSFFKPLGPFAAGALVLIVVLVAGLLLGINGWLRQAWQREKAAMSLAAANSAAGPETPGAAAIEVIAAGGAPEAGNAPTSEMADLEAPRMAPPLEAPGATGAAADNEETPPPSEAGPGA
jgi:hypothetical protein